MTIIMMPFLSFPKSVPSPSLLPTLLSRLLAWNLAALLLAAPEGGFSSDMIGGGGSSSDNVLRDIFKFCYPNLVVKMAPKCP